MKVLVIGKNSFFAKNLIKHNKCQAWQYVSHTDVIHQPDLLHKPDVILNLGVSPDVRTAEFKIEGCIEAFIARNMTANQSCRLVTISSRQIYGDSLMFSECDKPLPQTQYGRNKLAIELFLGQYIHDERLTILRCSNIFGFEIGRPTFFGLMLTTLLSDGVIKFDFPQDVKKDFMPIEDCCEVIYQVVINKIVGTFNVGAGISVAIGKLAEEVIKGYGAGAIECGGGGLDGQFEMNVSRLSSLIDYPTFSEDKILKSAFGLGRMLREENVSVSAIG